MNDDNISFLEGYEGINGNENLYRHNSINLESFSMYSYVDEYMENTSEKENKKASSCRRRCYIAHQKL